LKQIKIASFTLSTIAIVFFLAGCADDSSTNPVVIVPPTAPSGLSATMVSWSAVRLSWTDNSQDEEGFRVYQKEGVGNWSVTDTTGKNTTTVLVSGLTPETGYSFRVQSYKGNTGSSNSDSVSVLTSKEGVIYGYQFIKIPAGSFNMGSDSGKPYEKPVHLVTIAYDFWMMETEVTQKQWTAVTGSNPSFWKGDSLPVESVTWQECKNFIDSLNTLYPGKGFRFPTEAEWSTPHGRVRIRFSPWGMIASLVDGRDGTEVIQAATHIR